MSSTVATPGSAPLPEDDAARVFVFGGDLRHAAIADLMVSVEQAAADGARRVVLDLGDVRTCDRPALFWLAQARGPLPSEPGCTLELSGLRWSQFLAVVSDEPLETTTVLVAVVRRLLRADPLPGRPARPDDPPAAP
jgi:hypothetical protein